jgi:predicted GH43/DUF377 family glycosyl hydrolase
VPRYRRKTQHDTVHRWEGNPALTYDDLDFPCADIRNAGATEHEGVTYLLVDVVRLEGTHALHLARGSGGSRFEVDRKPFLSGSEDPEDAEHESIGVLDARITFIEGYYYIMYLAEGEHGFRLGLARTSDFKSVERLGLVSQPDTKAGALFTQRIGGRFTRIERPNAGDGIWLCFSDDLIYWGDHRYLFGPRAGYWDASRVGIGPPPIETDKGWLLIYYGAKDTSAGSLYRLGTALLDGEHPERVVGRANTPILAPREHYERVGDTPNVVFCTGTTVRPDGGVTVYYGCADSCISIGETSVEELVESCIADGKEY